MSNTALFNDKVYTFQIVTLSGAAIPSGTVITAVSSLPNSLSASMFGNTLTLTPKVLNSLGITVTLTAPGMGTGSMVFDIDTDPNLLVLAFGNPTTTSQTLPTAPGP